jgi:hypothetical protein
MGSLVVKGLYSLAFIAFVAGQGLASPVSSSLLSLVAPGAEIVGGFENHRDPDKHGRLLLTTHNNRLDLDDWQALTGADSNRQFAEVIEVAKSDLSGAISEHMLLVAGRFDRERIFHSVQENGAEATQYQGQPVLLIKPLAREQGDMLDTRWLVILDNRIGILGTQPLVQTAMERYAAHSLPDPILQERLSLLRPDASSWNVIAVSRMRAHHILFAQPHSAWAELQRDADVLMVAVHFGAKTRIDFSVDADAGKDTDFFTRKAAFFTDALKIGPHPEPTPPIDAQRRLANFAVESSRVQGSVELSAQQFEAWCEHLYRVRTDGTQPPAHGD